MHTVVAVGDIHGRFDLYLQLREQILENTQQYSKKKIIFLGDFIDRGPCSKEIVDSFINDPLPNFEHIFLMGNHEEWLLDFLNNNYTYEDLLAWLIYGGIETMQSYGMDITQIANKEEIKFEYHGLNRDVKQRLLPIIPEIFSKIPENHVKFYKSLKLHYRYKKYFFVHAGINPYIALEHQTSKDFLMIRDLFLNCTRNYGFKVVHGHTPHEDVFSTYNRICVDTGAFYSNKLSAVILTNHKEYSISTR